MNAYPTPPLVSSAKVVFIGGINSTGRKGWQLAQDGYSCTVPTTPNRNLTVGMASLLPNCLTGISSYLQDLKTSVLNCTKEQPDILVGSSQGGAVAMSLVQKEWQGTKLVLIAPAWKTFGVSPTVPKDTTILHGKHDWIVNPNDSKHLQEKNRCRLVQLDDNHHLSKSYKVILAEVDKMSIRTGKHKSEKVIRKEWQDYNEACKEWYALNCTKTVVTNQSLLESDNGWYYLEG